MKIIPLFVVLAIFVSACSNDNSSTERVFSIARADVQTGAISDVTNPYNVAKLPDTNKTVEVWVRLSPRAALRFEAFTRRNMNQSVQILVSTNVVAEWTVSDVKTNGDMDLFFSTDKEAKEKVFDALGIL